MSKGFDIVPLLEYMDRRTAFKPPKSKGTSRKVKKKEEDFDPIEFIRREKEKVARLEKYLKDEEKINKKEEKPAEKDPSKTLSYIEWFIIGALAHPLIGMLFNHFIPLGAHQ